MESTADLTPELDRLLYSASLALLQCKNLRGVVGAVLSKQSVFADHPPPPLFQGYSYSSRGKKGFGGLSCPQLPRLW